MSSLFRQNAEIARENPRSPKRRFLTRPTLTRGKGVYLKREKGGELAYHCVPTSPCRRNYSLQQSISLATNQRECLIGFKTRLATVAPKGRTEGTAVAASSQGRLFPFRRMYPYPCPCRSRPRRGRPSRNVAVTFQKTKTKNKLRFKAGQASARGQS